MTLSNAERQARWREKRNSLAKAASDPAGLAERLEALTPDALASMTAPAIERLQKAAQRVVGMARKERERIASAR